MKKLLFLTGVMISVIALSSCSKTKKLAKQHSALQDTYETLKRDMSEAQVTLEGEKVKVVLPEAVLFNVNSAEMNREYLPIMAKMAAILNKYDKTTVLITGYTDATGTETYNQDLSKKRAESAREVLVSNKVSVNRIYTWGMSDKNPIGDNKTLTGRKLNRRVEYVILYDYKPEKK